jgi:hypothetical protein
MPDFREPRQPLVAPGAIDCHAADLTATISADMPLKIAQWRLGEFDQWIPIDGDPDLPVGRLVEQNSTGPLRLGYGGWRDLLLGCQFRIGDEDDLKTGRGELITAGGRTMKNVAGYDLTKLMVGQRGFFGKIVTITVRTYRRPAMALVAKFAPTDALLGQLMTTPLRPRWAAITAAPPSQSSPARRGSPKSGVPRDKPERDETERDLVVSPPALWLGWLDDQPAIDLFEKLLNENRAGESSSIEVKPIEIIRRSLSVDVAHRSQLWKRSGDSFRAAVPPTKILRFVELAEITDWTADAGFGIVVGSTGGGATGMGAMGGGALSIGATGGGATGIGAMDTGAREIVAPGDRGVPIRDSQNEPTADVDEPRLRAAADAVGGSVTIFRAGEPPAWRGKPEEVAILEKLRAAFSR